MAEGTFVLTANVSGFEQGLNQAQRRAQGFEESVGGLFRRSPFQRAETALADFTAQLSAGNLGGAISSLLTRISAFGVLASAGIGAAIIGAQKLKHAIDESDASAKKLTLDMATMGGIKTGEQARGFFQQQLKDFEDFQKQRQGSKAVNLISNLLGGTRDIDQLEIALTSLQKIGNLMDDQVTAHQRLENIAYFELRGLTEQAELEKESLKTALEKADVEREAIARRKQLLELLAKEKDPNVKLAIDALIEKTRINEQAEKASIDRIEAYRVQAIRRSAIEQQKTTFQKAIGGFTPASAAATQQFLIEKLQHETDPAEQQQLRMKIDQLQLLRKQQQYEQNKDILDRTIPYGPGSRLFFDNLRQKNRLLMPDIDALTQKVFAEQKGVQQVKDAELLEAVKTLNNTMNTIWQ